MYYTGIDLHKFTSFLTTVEPDGNVVKKDNFKIFLITSFSISPLSPVNISPLLNLLCPGIG